MLDLSDRPKDDTDSAPRPLTQQDRWNGVVFVVSFIVWLPLYLFVVRPFMNAFLFRFVSSYPAMLHLFPIFGMPWLLTEVFERIARVRAGGNDGGGERAPDD